MHDKFDSIEKIRFIHGLMKKEVEELMKFVSSSKMTLSETSTPPVDVVINDREVVIYAELPGLSTNDFTVYQYDDLIVLEGIRPKIPVPNISYVRMEREAARFKRIIRLPFNVNDSESTAKLKDGVLEMRISRASAVIEEK